MPELSSRRRGAIAEALAVSVTVTLAVAIAVEVGPPAWHAVLVAAIFLGATWMGVWRHDDERVERAGLALGGIAIGHRPSARALARDAASALAWSLGLFAVVAVPFFVGWRVWWDPKFAFALALRPGEVADEVIGQVLVIALPEEAFYRGYLQSRLDEAWPPGWRVLGARIGPGLFASAAIFAIGHIVTVPLATRLAVFFPALVFGWLRARTGGIGASLLFHASCNVYSQLLGRAYGLY